mmetsp:Transcript_47405/g.109722  ORF Transcript_47405/g.109722 Transcript_47405/m.109722 type:complete len:865 (+) Transcript_47405:50-2644(+)
MPLSAVGQAWSPKKAAVDLPSEDSAQLLEDGEGEDEETTETDDEQDTSEFSQLLDDEQDPNSFREHVWLAFRVAVGVIVLTAPIIVKRGTLDWMDEIRDRGLVMRFGAAMFLYTVYTNTGSTIGLGWSSVAGTFLSCFNMWLMEGFFPGGYRGEDQLSLWVMLADTVLFVVLVLSLNLNMNTRIFALSSFVFHAMTFLDPAQDTGRSVGFALDFDSYEIKEIKAATVGCMIATLVTLLPCPLWAHEHAVSTANRLIKVLDGTWRHCSSLMCSSVSDHYTLDKIYKGIRELKADLSTLSLDINDSYWELFGRKHAHNRRKCLYHLHGILSSYHTNICCVFDHCMEETYGDKHTKFMGLISAHVDSLISETGNLLQTCLAVARHGYFRGAKRDQLKQGIEQTRAAIVGLTQQFLDAKATLGLEGITKELIDEHGFCVNLCIYARIAADYAQDLLQHLDGTRTLEGPPKQQFCHIQYMDSEHIIFSVRNSLTILIALGLCWRKWEQYWPFREYDAGIACVSAILLSKYMGSAITKSLQRIIGTVVGTVFGQLVYATFAWCHWWGYLSLMMTIFIWVWATVFMYFHIPEWSSVGCLLAVFGVNNMIGTSLKVAGCDGIESLQDVHLDSYYDIVNIVAALLLGGIVDAAMMTRNARHLACNEIEKVWRDTLEGIKSILDPSSLEVRVCSTKINQKLQRAKILGQEAKQELNFSEVPWRADEFEAATDSALNLLIMLECLESAASRGVDGSRKDADFLRATQLKNFQGLREFLFESMQEVDEQLKLLMSKQEPAKKPPLRRLSKDEVACVERFLREAQTIQWESTVASDFTLESDGPAQVSALLAGVLGMLRAVKTLHRKLTPVTNTHVP